MAHLKNLFTGSWSYGSYRNDGVWIPSPSPENPSNNIGETDYIKIDPNKSATFSWSGWSKSIPSDVTIHSYHTSSDLTSYAKVVIDRLSQTVTDNSITFENADGADYIRLYFHDSGSATQYQPLGFQITQAGVFDDVAFKVIVKNDGISDIIMKTIMLKGEAGGTISSIEKTSSVGVVDTYTITLNDGTTTTFEVTNGSNIESIEKTASSGLIDTYTVTLTNGDTSTFEVKNGEDAQLYELPQDCVVGYDNDADLTTAESYTNYLAVENVNGIKSIKCGGNTLQDTDDGRNLIYPKYQGRSDKGVDFTVNSDGSITCYGLATENAYSAPNLSSDESKMQKVQAGTYTLSGAIPNSARVYLGGKYIDGTSLPFTTDTGNGRTFTLTQDAWIYPEVLIPSGVNADFTVYIQLEVGSTATPYQPYCGGKPAPNPDYPRNIDGYGKKQSDGTYTVTFDVIDGDDNVFTLTASGLAYPIYQGDWIDFLAGKVIRANKKLVFDGSESWSSYASGNGYSLELDNLLTQYFGDGRSNRFLNANPETASEPNRIQVGNNNKTIYFLNVDISGVTDLASWKSYLANNETFIVYTLAPYEEELVTITGETEIIKKMKDSVVEFRPTMRFGNRIIVQYYDNSEFPDGYEEIDFPLDDLFYYQDQEYIEFPQAWGFLTGYVFDANEIRFVMNVTKGLKEGISLVTNKSADLALNLYTGTGGSNLTGFNFVESSFIPAYGQIQIRLKTENPHGLTVGSLLGARVSQGRLRITFEEEEEQ